MNLSRKSGILMHITSLPSAHGIGDLGEGAYRFADFLQSAAQGLWQILPLNPTNSDFGHSPYSSASAFALNPLLIDLNPLVQQHLLSAEEPHTRPSFSGARVDYDAVTEWKEKMLQKAFEGFRGGDVVSTSYRAFCEVHREWLDDHALFTALSCHYGGIGWHTWPEALRDRREDAVEEARESHADAIALEKFKQYLCFQQWQDLREYCSRKGIILIGDIPLYISYESSDVWANPRLFKLDHRRRPRVVSGVPPDFFSATGQLWNNPIYDWDRLKRERCAWWVDRIAHNLHLFDCIRIDHFRGLAGYWEVPAGADTAEEGRWVEGPGGEFLEVIAGDHPSMPFIAEDLGVITEDVTALRDRFGLPGMRVFQFGFGRGRERYHRPKSYPSHCVAYTGTHDNDTLAGWLFDSPGAGRTRRVVRRYVGCLLSGRDRLRWSVMRSLIKSRADWVIFPMQDILGLPTSARMNRPGRAEGNWRWRMPPDAMDETLAERLRSLAVRHGRMGMEEHPAEM
jgi:4-alpha-glucanotransferase